MASRLLAITFALTLLAFAGPCAADEAPAQPTVESHWYGWQILPLDVLSVAVTAATPEIPAGPIAFALGGPIVHLVHRRPSKAIGSFLLRVTLPLVGAFMGALVDRSSFAALYGGVITGASLASVIDIAAIAHDTGLGSF